MLTAWIHPDPALTSAAVAAAEADGYLVAAPPAARPSGRTLADVLVPEEQDLVPPAVVERYCGRFLLRMKTIFGRTAQKRRARRALRW